MQFRRPKIFYGWYIVFATGFVMTIATVPLFHAMTLWAVALENHFGWPRGQLSLALTLTRIEGGLMGPVEGYLTDKLGGRKMVLIGFLILGLGFLIFWQIDARFWPVAPLYMFYVAYMVMALGQGMGSWVPMMTTINNWFSRRMASAMGWANFMSRGGALLIIPLIDLGINGSVGVPFTDITLGINHVIGWEGVAFILAIVILAVALPLSFIIRNRPEDYGMLPDGERPEDVERRRDRPSRAAPLSPSVEFTASQALRTRTFWLIAIGHGFTSMAIIAIMAHLAPMLTDQGLTLPQAAWVVSTYTVTSMVFQIIGGYIGDSIPKNVGLFIFTMVQAASLLVLTFATEVWMAFAFAALFGIGFGGRSPLTTSIRGEYFGRRSFGTIMGISQVPMNVLLLAAPVFPGILYDMYGDYTLAFSIIAGLNFVGGFLFLLARKPTLPQTSRRREVSPSGRRNGNPLGYIIGSARRRRGEGATAQRTQATGAESPQASRGPAVGDGQE